MVVYFKTSGLLRLSQNILYIFQICSFIDVNMIVICCKERYLYVTIQMLLLLHEKCNKFLHSKTDCKTSTQLSFSAAKPAAGHPLN